MKPSIEFNKEINTRVTVRDLIVMVTFLFNYYFLK